MGTSAGRSFLAARSRPPFLFPLISSFPRLRDVSQSEQRPTPLFSRLFGYFGRFAALRILGGCCSSRVGKKDGKKSKLSLRTSLRFMGAVMLSIGRCHCSSINYCTVDALRALHSARSPSSVRHQRCGHGCERETCVCTCTYAGGTRRVKQ